MGATVLENRMGCARLSLNPSSVTSLSTSAQSFTCNGLVYATDQILRTAPSSLTSGIGVSAVVQSNNNVTLFFTNVTAAPLTPHRGLYYLTWFRPDGGPRDGIVGT